MKNTELPRGLRHVVIYVWINEPVPLIADSPTDIALLRVANRALKRKTEGVTDSFLSLFAEKAKV